MHLWPLLALSLALSAAFIAPAGASDADALKDAASDFRAYCASCHGLEGRGDGPTAEVLKTRPSDLTQISRRNGGAFPAKQVYAKIDGRDMPVAHGTTDMPVWGMWFTHQAIGESLLLKDARPTEERVTERITALVSFLESIQED